jgi:hypothetical protein
LDSWWGQFSRPLSRISRSAKDENPGHAETFRDIVETWGNGEFRAVRARIWRVYEDKTAEGPEALENKTAQGLEALGNKAAATSERLRDKAAATSESLPDKAAGDPDRVLQHMRELRVALEDDYWELLIPLEFFENAGMLVKYRAISIQMVDNSLGLLVCEYWKMLRPFIYARERPATSRNEDDRTPCGATPFGMSGQTSNQSVFTPWAFRSGVTAACD